MYKFDEVNRFLRLPNETVKNPAFPVKNKGKFISSICVGTIYCNVHVLTDANLNYHAEYHRYMRACSTMQSKFIYTYI